MSSSKPSRNPLQHGAFAVGRMPRGASYIGRQASALRRALCEAVTARHPGELSVIAQARINRAVRQETLALLWARWLRLEPTLSISERLEITKRIADATEARDKAIEALDLDDTTPLTAEELRRRYYPNTQVGNSADFNT